MTDRLRRLELTTMSRRERATLLRRSAVPDPDVRRNAAEICDDVAARGDAAVRDYAERFGGGFRRVPDAEIDAAVAGLAPEVTDAIESAAANVRAYHTAQLPRDLDFETAPGITIRRRWTPLTRVGCYVPGGKAAYPSTVIMTVVPARVAGAAQVVVCTPEAPDGTLSPAMLAACRIAGADEVWAMGGAQGIAALAYGTETVEPVETIVGPGNSWVTAAKLAVYGVCSIDLPAGPSEVLVLADHSSEARLVAVDLLCQAEHGPDSPAVLVTTDPGLVDRVEAELDRLLPTLDRAGILEQALEDHGWAVVAADIADAIAFANEYAGEHVSIATEQPEEVAKQVTSAGSVYIGRWAPESAGDYATGANHVLPTGGLAAACGPLSVEDFGSWRQEQHLTRDGLAAITDTIATLATAEGLTAHRLAALIRFEDEEQS
ncbi:MAG: histidinol dehydrogenase [Acidimicrobiia bacterium]|nr:histidinol dehydrogenase [Acidimicrobiia bacterium]